ncbi:olfactory receptor 1468-like [Lithobates pipiens]
MAVYNLLLFTLVLIIYIVTICGNFLIIMLVYFSKTLHSPMYFFLSQLCLSDIILTTDISPNMLNIVLHERTSISFSGCIFQYCVYSIIEIFECYHLTVMSYDRYLAICSPLHYVSIMKQSLCIKLIIASWLLSCSITIIFALGICELEFCGPNVIDYFYCDINPLMELSCSDTSKVQMEATLFSFPVLILPFLLIVVSYACIVVTLLKIPSFSGRLKSFSTCSSHLTVVFIFYGTLIAMYLIPKEGQSRTTSNIMSLLYTVFTPFVNPFIYSLRNKDIKKIVNNIVYSKS